MYGSPSSLTCPRSGERTKGSGAEVIKGKGGAGFAVGIAIRDVIESIALDSRKILPVSTVQSGCYGIRDVALSVPTVARRVLFHAEMQIGKIQWLKGMTRETRIVLRVPTVSSFTRLSLGRALSSPRLILLSCFPMLRGAGPNCARTWHGSSLLGHRARTAHRRRAFHQFSNLSHLRSAGPKQGS